MYYLLHREQLHASALDNGHLQVVYETLSKQLYKTYIWATYMGYGWGKVGTRSRICPKGWMMWVAWKVHAWTLHATHIIQPLGQILDLVPTLPHPYPI